MVLAVRRGGLPSPSAGRQLRSRDRRGVELRQPDAIALPVRADYSHVPDVLPGPRLLLVQPVAAADSGRVGDDQADAGQGRGQPDLVAFEDRAPAGGLPTGAPVIQQVDAAAAPRWARRGDAAEPA